MHRGRERVRASGCSRRRSRHGAPAKAWLATVAKPRLVGAQREQQVGDPVGRRQLGVGGRTQKQWTRRPPGVTSSAPASPTSHDTELAALHREAGLALELALLVAEQVAEQSLRDALRRARAAGPCGGHVRPRGTRTARG